MDRKKGKEELTILEAVDNLSSIADLDITGAMEEGETKESVEEWEREGGLAHKFDPHDVEKNRGVVKETFKVIHDYLKHMYEKDKPHLKDVETQKGIQAIMVLAGEAAQKIDKFTTLFKGTYEKESITELKEYQELQQFYLTKIMKRFHEALETEEAWQKEWGGFEEELLDVQRRGLKDLETVKRDKEYELFFIRKEDGRPFFNRNLLRHIKLVGDFDETLSDPEGEDPFLRIKMIQDRDLHATAKEILHTTSKYIDSFYKDALKHKEVGFVSSLNKSLMGLMLAANSRNLMQNTMGKSCLSYYADFHFYLREALASSEYQKFVSHAPDASDHFFHTLLNLSHALCCSFFMRTGTRKEAVELIERLIQKGQEGKGPAPKEPFTLSLWNNVLDDYDRIRNLLKRYPNGPLLKTLDIFREGLESQGFDPLSQENMPQQLYSFSCNEQHVTCLRVPSPVHQEVINKVEVAEEFRGFLRFLNTMMDGKKHLLVNLQDRTSWEEHNRCLALEDLQKQAEFSRTLFVVTLPKNTDFYYQSANYQDVSQAQLFIDQFKEQIASGEQCGFYFPPALKIEDIKAFANEAIDRIHEVFFSKKNVLTRKNRLDFIEIFYDFFTLKLIEMLRPDSLSFTCKDAIDTGVAASSGFFAFLRLLSSSKPWTKEEREFFLWMLHAPALFIRERPIDAARLNRMVSAAAALHAELEGQKESVVKTCNQLFQRDLLSHIAIQEDEINKAL